MLLSQVLDVYKRQGHTISTLIFFRMRDFLKRIALHLAGYKLSQDACTLAVDDADLVLAAHEGCIYKTLQVMRCFFREHTADIQLVFKKTVVSDIFGKARMLLDLSLIHI